MVCFGFCVYLFFFILICHTIAVTETHHAPSLRLDSEELCILGGSCVMTSFMACYDIYPVELCTARG